MTSPNAFFKILVFWVVWLGKKGQKMAQNDKKLCVQHLNNDRSMVIDRRKSLCDCQNALSNVPTYGNNFH